MHPKLATISAFSVAGISVRTINSDEFNPGKAKLANLWARFYSENVAANIQGQKPDSLIYGVYTDYASDASGEYTVTAGKAVITAESGNNPDFDTVTVEAGRYLVFSTRAAMPQAVIDTWIRVWHYFEINSEYKRSFRTDFEAYRGIDEISIYISVK